MVASTNCQREKSSTGIQRTRGVHCCKAVKGDWKPSWKVRRDKKNSYTLKIYWHELVVSFWNLLQTILTAIDGPPRKYLVQLGKGNIDNFSAPTSFLSFMSSNSCQIFFLAAEMFGWYHTKLVKWNRPIVHEFRNVQCARRTISGPTHVFRPRQAFGVHVKRIGCCKDSSFAQETPCTSSGPFQILLFHRDSRANGFVSSPLTVTTSSTLLTQTFIDFTVSDLVLLFAQLLCWPRRCLCSERQKTLGNQFNSRYAELQGKCKHWEVERWCRSHESSLGQSEENYPVKSQQMSGWEPSTQLFVQCVLNCPWKMLFPHCDLNQIKRHCKPGIACLNALKREFS